MRCRATLVAAAVLLAAAAAPTLAVQLRDAGLVAGAAPTLQDASGTVRLVNARLLSTPTVVPEPGMGWLLGTGAAVLAMLGRRRAAKGSKR